MKLTLRLLAFTLVALSLLTGCVNYRQLVNFEGVPFEYNVPEDIANQLVVRIQPNDILYIRVFSYDAEGKAAAPFNLDAGQQNSGQVFVGGGNNNNFGAQILFGYLVDAEGIIDMPVIGPQKVGGLTLSETKEMIRLQLLEYLREPVVNIRFLNFRVTILGEVSAPGTIPVPNERFSIFDALGLAGDLTEYADRQEILVIREKDGQREYGLLNLQSRDIFQSPYFYLAQNDVIYVKPLKVRTATVADPAQRMFSYISGGLSIISIIIALTR